MSGTLDRRYVVFNLIVGLCAVNCAFLVSYYLTFSDVITARDVNSEASYRNLLVIANLLYVVVGLRPASFAKRELRNYSFFLLSYLAMIVFLKAYEFSRVFHLYFLGILFLFTLVWRYSNILEVLREYVFSDSSVKKVLLVGEAFDPSIIQYINDRPGDYKCVGILSEELISSNMQREFGFRDAECGHVGQLESVLAQSPIDEVLISTAVLSTEKVDAIIRTTERYHTTASLLPQYFHFLTQQSCRTEYWMGVPIISVFHTKLSVEIYRASKRALDICFSLLVLTFVFPVLCFAIAPAIWISGRGPIFFKQLRKGYKQEPFFCYKFRTMVLDHEAEAIQAKKQDPRVTIVGKTLRKTNLDEVPQFFNVLSGKMSVVGPRPHMVEHDEIYEKWIDRYNVRFVTKPGITGWAQVNGYRGATEDDSLMEKRIEHDLWYIKNWSIWLDIKIIFLTIWGMLRGDKNAF